MKVKRELSCRNFICAKSNKESKRHLGTFDLGEVFYRTKKVTSQSEVTFLIGNLVVEISILIFLWFIV